MRGAGAMSLSSSKASVSVTPTCRKPHHRLGAAGAGRGPLLGRVLITAEELTSGPLSLPRNESIFRNDILPGCLPEATRQAEPPRLILLGQLGAGKTAVLIASHAEREQAGSTIRIVGNNLRSYPPTIPGVAAKGPRDCIKLCADGCRAMDREIADGCGRATGQYRLRDHDADPGQCCSRHWNCARCQMTSRRTPLP
jgi:hypothetical protein